MEKKEESEDEFAMEEVGSNEEVPTVKTAPFNASINLGPVDRPPISKEPPRL